MEFEIIPEHEQFQPRAGASGYTWPDEVFDGQQRLVTPTQIKEMGYQHPESAGVSFRKAAQTRNLRAMVVTVQPGRKYPNGGIAIRTLPLKNPLKHCPNPLHVGLNPLPLTGFYKNRGKPGGVEAWCKNCSNAERAGRRDADGSSAS